MPRKIMVYGKRSRRVYVRLDECEYAGLQRLGVLNGMCVGAQAYQFIRQALVRWDHADKEFSAWWLDECRRIVREEIGT